MNKNKLFLLLSLFCCAVINTQAQTNSLEVLPQTAVDDSFYTYVPKVDYGTLFEQSGTTSFTTEYSPSGSYWLDPTDADEEHVYLAKLQHDAATAENSWELRIGKGGQIYSFKSAYGEGIPPQSKEKSTWNDEVWQPVSVNTTLNNRDFTSMYYFVHGAGAYNYDGVEQTFYSPLMASYYDETEKAYYVTNWGTQAHIPSLYKSEILYTTKYKEIGEGILEVTYVIQNFGDVTINHINAPWGGVRASSLRGKYLSSPDGSIAINYANTGTEVGSLSIDIDETGGFMLWAADTLNPTAPSLGVVFGDQIKTDELSEHGLSNIFMRLAQVGGDANPRDYTLFTLIPKLNVEKGETFYYRTYYINGTRDFVQEKSNILAPYSDYGFIEATPNETPASLITAAGFEQASSTDFELFTSPIENTVPLFLMENTATGEQYISPDLYYNVDTATLVNPYEATDENFELYENRFTYKVHHSDIEYIRLLGYAYAEDMSANEAYVLLDDIILDDTKIVLTEQYTNQLWVKIADAVDVCDMNIVPRSQVYSENTTSSIQIEITEGDSLIFKPQVTEAGVTSTGTGNWTWQKPDATNVNGRVLLFEPIALTDKGIYEVTYQVGSCETSTQLDVLVNEKVITTSENQNLNDDISVYPNPTSGIIHFSTESRYQITDALGTIIQEGLGDQTDISTQPNGVYFLKVIVNGQQTIQKIIKH